MNALDDINRISSLVNYYCTPGSVRILPEVRNSLIERISILQEALQGNFKAKKKLEDLTAVLLNLPLGQANESSSSSSSSDIQPSSLPNGDSLKEEDPSIKPFHSFPLEIIEKIFRSSDIAGQKKMIVAVRNKCDLFIERFLRIFISERYGSDLNKSYPAVKNMNAIIEEQIKLAHVQKDRIAAGKMMADIVNTNKLSFKEVEAFPEFEKYVLPHLEYYNFQNNTAGECLKYIEASDGKERNIRELYLPDDFNRSIPSKVLNDLRILDMGAHFNQPFSAAVTFSNLRELRMGRSFNQRFPEAVTFSSLRELHMSNLFNQPFPEAVTFSNLQELRMGGRFNQPFPAAVTFSNLRELHMGYRFNHLFPEAVTFSKLRELHMGYRFNHLFPEAVTFSKLRELRMGGSFNQRFPEAVTFSNLRELHMGVDFNQPFPAAVTFSNLRELHMGYRFNHLFPEAVTFSNLQELRMGGSFNQPFPEAVTFSNLRELRMGRSFNQRFPEAVTFSSLRELHMSNLFNQPFPEAVTFSNLRELHMGVDFNQPFPAAVTFSNLRELHMGCRFNQPFPEAVTFSRLNRLDIGLNFRQPFLDAILFRRFRELRMIRCSRGGPLPDGNTFNIHRNLQMGRGRSDRLPTDFPLSVFEQVREGFLEVFGGALLKSCLLIGRIVVLNHARLGRKFSNTGF